MANTKRVVEVNDGDTWLDLVLMHDDEGTPTAEFVLTSEGGAIEETTVALNLHDVRKLRELLTEIEPLLAAKEGEAPRG